MCVCVYIYINKTVEMEDCPSVFSGHYDSHLITHVLDTAAMK